MYVRVKNNFFCDQVLHFSASAIQLILFSFSLRARERRGVTFLELGFMSRDFKNETRDAVSSPTHTPGCTSFTIPT